MCSSAARTNTISLQPLVGSGANRPCARWRRRRADASSRRHKIYARCPFTPRSKLGRQTPGPISVPGWKIVTRDGFLSAECFRCRNPGGDYQYFARWIPIGETRLTTSMVAARPIHCSTKSRAQCRKFPASYPTGRDGKVDGPEAKTAEPKSQKRDPLSSLARRYTRHNLRARSLS